MLLLLFKQLSLNILTQFNEVVIMKKIPIINGDDGYC